jgi:hypothetical protein
VLTTAIDRGSSGAWVVQGSKLIGIIIAVYDDEPYAHMLDIASVFQDIRALLSDGEHVPNVLVSGQVTLDTQPNESTSLLTENLTLNLATAGEDETCPEKKRETIPCRAWHSAWLLGNNPSETTVDPEKSYLSEEETYCTAIGSVRGKLFLSGIMLAYSCIHVVSVKCARLQIATNCGSRTMLRFRSYYRRLPTHSTPCDM